MYMIFVNMVDYCLHQIFHICLCVRLSLAKKYCWETKTPRFQKGNCIFRLAGWTIKYCSVTSGLTGCLPTIWTVVWIFSKMLLIVSFFTGLNHDDNFYRVNKIQMKIVPTFPVHPVNIAKFYVTSICSGWPLCQVHDLSNNSTCSGINLD